MHERWFDADGRWVHTADWEPTEPRPGAIPVVLVHGLGASTLSWELVGHGIADRLGTRVTALDLPGFGRSRADAPRPWRHTATRSPRCCTPRARRS